MVTLSDRSWGRGSRWMIDERCIPPAVLFEGGQSKFKDTIDGTPSFYMHLSVEHLSPQFPNGAFWFQIPSWLYLIRSCLSTRPVSLSRFPGRDQWRPQILRSLFS